jgi:hypothetical protein
MRNDDWRRTRNQRACRASRAGSVRRPESVCRSWAPACAGTGASGPDQARSEDDPSGRPGTRNPPQAAVHSYRRRVAGGRINHGRSLRHGTAARGGKRTPTQSALRIPDRPNRDRCDRGDRRAQTEGALRIPDRPRGDRCAQTQSSLGIPDRPHRDSGAQTYRAFRAPDRRPDGDGRAPTRCSFCAPDRRPDDGRAPTRCSFRAPDRGSAGPQGGGGSQRGDGAGCARDRTFAAPHPGSIVATRRDCHDRSKGLEPGARRSDAACRAGCARTGRYAATHPRAR